MLFADQVLCVNKCPSDGLERNSVLNKSIHKSSFHQIMKAKCKSVIYLTNLRLP